MTSTRDIDLDLHQDDIELLGELIRKYHPQGVSVPKGVTIFMGPESPVMGLRLPKALVEWVCAMNKAYGDKEFVLALIKRILEELGIIQLEQDGTASPVNKSIN